MHDFIIAGNKLKIGGRLSRMVKEKELELKKVLKVKEGEGDEREKERMGYLPKYAYLRINAISKREVESQGEEEEEVEMVRK